MPLFPDVYPRPGCPQRGNRENFLLKAIVPIVCCLFTGQLLAQTQTSLGRLEITVTGDEGSGPIPCRIHLKDAEGKSVKPEKLPYFRDHFVCSGKVQLDLSPGDY